MSGSEAEDRLQFRNAGVGCHPFHVKTTAHERMNLAMIGIRSRRQPAHAELFAGMKVFGGKGACPATPAPIVRHGMRLHGPVVPLDRLPREDGYGRGRIERRPIQKENLRTSCLTQVDRKDDDKHDPAETKTLQHYGSPFRKRHEGRPCRSLSSDKLRNVASSRCTRTRLEGGLRPLPVSRNRCCPSDIALRKE